MVRIYGLDSKERELLKKQSLLEQLAKTFVDDGDICVVSNAISLYKNSVLVLPSINEIIVRDPIKLEMSIELATAYEKACNEEFSVKKEYLD